MHLFVRSISGRYLTLETDSQASISSLSHQIALKEGIPTSHQRLIYGGKQLAPGLTVSDYGIPCEGTIDLSLRLCGGMRITLVPTWERDRFDLEIRGEETIWEIKTRLMSVFGGKAYEQQFEYQENLLRNDQTAAESGLTEGAEVKVTVMTMCTAPPSQ